MNIIKTALLGATALSLTIGFGSTTAFAGGLNENAQSIQNHGGGIPVPPKTGKPKVYAASVDADGTLVVGEGATSAESLGTGDYQVNFSTSVAGCAYLATLGNSTYGTAPAGSITDAERAGSGGDAVWVEIRNDSGTNVDENFHLAVVCPG